MNAPRNGFDVTEAVYNVYSSIGRLSEHHMIPADVCDGQEPACSTFNGRRTDVTFTRCSPWPVALRNGFDVTEALYRVHSSIGRLPEHHMVPANVCDGQEPA